MSYKKNFIKYYSLRRYEEYKDYTLEQLIELKKRIDSGEVSLKGKIYARDKRVKTEDLDEADDLSMVDGANVRKFVYDAKHDEWVALEIKKKKNDVDFIRVLYSNTTLTRNEVAFLLSETDGRIRYYLKKFGILKLPIAALTKLQTVKGIKKFLTKPLPDMVSVPTDESSEEFRERYNSLSYKLFYRLKQLSLNPNADLEEVRKINTTITALSNNMKLELESKILLRAEKIKEYEMKDKELQAKKGGNVEILEVNDDIEMQQKMYSLQEKLRDEGMEQEKIDTILKEFI